MIFSCSLVKVYFLAEDLGHCRCRPFGSANHVSLFHPRFRTEIEQPSPQIAQLASLQSRHQTFTEVEYLIISIRPNLNVQSRKRHSIAISAETKLPSPTSITRAPPPLRRNSESTRGLCEPHSPYKHDWVKT
jgi:hypothetical protein